MKPRITCTEFEILLADFLDGTLHADARETIETHQAACEACAELARDAAGAVTFIERVAEVPPPPAMVNRILFEVTSGPSRGVIKPTMAERFVGALLAPFGGAKHVLQPRFAMGMAMAVLSLAMLGRFGAAAESGVHRAWDRAMKSYESLQLVYQVQSQLQEWSKNTGADNK